MKTGFANKLVVGALQEGTGIETSGPVATALVTTGASLLLTRGRRGFGAALLAAGGLLLWRESIRREQAEAMRAGPAVRPAARGAAAATGSH